MSPTGRTQAEIISGHASEWRDFVIGHVHLWVFWESAARNMAARKSVVNMLPSELFKQHAVRHANFSGSISQPQV